MELPIKLGNNYIVRLSTVYSILYNKKYGIKPTPNYAQFGKVFKVLIEFYNEYQIAFFMLQFFDGVGLDENDNKWLASKNHNLLFLKNKVDTIRTYAKNRLDINSDDTNEIKSLIDNII